jgi:hypothetical protein
MQVSRDLLLRAEFGTKIAGHVTLGIKSLWENHPKHEIMRPANEYAAKQNPGGGKSDYPCGGRANETIT